MKIQFASDLHTEFDQRPLRRNNVVGKSDILILAGDIAGTPRELASTVEKLAFPGPVIVVLGNHEFYHVAWDQGVGLYQHAFQNFPSVHVLENDSIVIFGVRILGCSLWTDFFDGSQGPASEGRLISDPWEEGVDGLADFKYIHWSKSGSPRTPNLELKWEDVRSRHLESLEWLKTELSTPFPGKTIVVTHHSPSILSNDPTYSDSPVTGAFCNRLDDYIVGLGKSAPEAWIHGHCHNSSDYLIGKTRILCNPAGYPFEKNLDFDPERTIEL